MKKATENRVKFSVVYETQRGVTVSIVDPITAAIDYARLALAQGRLYQIAGNVDGTVTVTAAGVAPITFEEV